MTATIIGVIIGLAIYYAYRHKSQIRRWISDYMRKREDKE